MSHERDAKDELKPNGLRGIPPYRGCGSNGRYEVDNLMASNNSSTFFYVFRNFGLRKFGLNFDKLQNFKPQTSDLKPPTRTSTPS